MSWLPLGLLSRVHSSSSNTVLLYFYTVHSFSPLTCRNVHLPIRVPLLHRPQRSIRRIPHLLPNPLLQLLLLPWDPLHRRQALFNRLPDHRTRNMHTDLAHVHDIRQQALIGILKRRRLRRQRLDGRDQHLVRQQPAAGQHAAEPDPGEARAVITLGDLVLAALVRDGREGRARGDQGPALRPLVDVLGVCLVQPRRVREREHDRPVYMRGHLADDFAREGFGFGGSADQNVRFDFFDDGEEVRVIFAFPFGIFARVRDLGGRELVAVGL